MRLNQTLSKFIILFNILAFSAPPANSSSLLQSEGEESEQGRRAPIVPGPSSRHPEGNGREDVNVSMQDFSLPQAQKGTSSRYCLKDCALRGGEVMKVVLSLGLGAVAATAIAGSNAYTFEDPVDTLFHSRFTNQSYQSHFLSAELALALVGAYSYSFYKLLDYGHKKVFPCCEHHRIEEERPSASSSLPFKIALGFTVVSSAIRALPAVLSMAQAEHSNPVFRDIALAPIFMLYFANAYKVVSEGAKKLMRGNSSSSYYHSSFHTRELEEQPETARLGIKHYIADRLSSGLSAFSIYGRFCINTLALTDLCLFLGADPTTAAQLSIAFAVYEVTTQTVAEHREYQKYFEGWLDALSSLTPRALWQTITHPAYFLDKSVKGIAHGVALGNACILASPTLFYGLKAFRDYSLGSQIYLLGAPMVLEVAGWDSNLSESYNEQIGDFGRFSKYIFSKVGQGAGTLVNATHKLFAAQPSSVNHDNDETERLLNASSPSSGGLSSGWVSSGWDKVSCFLRRKPASVKPAERSV